MCALRLYICRQINALLLARPCLAFTRCSVLWRLLCTNQSYTSQAPPLFMHSTTPHPSPTLVGNIVFPPTPLYCNIYPIRLAMAISCTGQGRVECTQADEWALGNTKGAHRACQLNRPHEQRTHGWKQAISLSQFSLSLPIA